MKRRNIEGSKIRRLPIKQQKTRVSDSLYNSAFVYLKILSVWVLVVLVDFFIEFRFEYLWPLWMLIRSFYDSFKYQGLAFSMFFLCITITSDIVCYLFVPVQVLFFTAGTYVWVQYVWQTERGVCIPTTLLWLLFLYVEAVVRLKELKNYSFSLDLCRPFAAHCVGYPVITMGFSIRSSISHRFRLRRQKEVQKDNQFFMQLLEEALPPQRPPMEDGVAIAAANNTTHTTNSIISNSITTTTTTTTTSSYNITTTSASSKNFSVSSISNITSLFSNIKETFYSSKGDNRKHKMTDYYSYNDKNSTDGDNNYECKDDHNDDTDSKNQLIPSINNTHHTSSHNDKNNILNGSIKSTVKSTKKNKTSSAYNTYHNTNNINHINPISNYNNNANTASNLNSINSILANSLNNNNDEFKQNIEYESSINVSTASNSYNNINNSHFDDASPSLTIDVNKDLILNRLELENKRLKSELSSSRASEVELRCQLTCAATSEKLVKSELSQAKNDYDSLQTKFQKQSSVRQQDKQNIAALEKKLADEKKQKAQLENQLNAEKKKKAEDVAIALKNSAKSGECDNESCKLRRCELDGEMKRMRKALDEKDERVASVEEELKQQRLSQQEIEVLKTALSNAQDKNARLETSLSSETRLKLDLFSALGDAKRQMEIQAGLLMQKDRDLNDLHSRLNEALAYLPTSSFQNNHQLSMLFSSNSSNPSPPLNYNLSQHLLEQQQIQQQQLQQQQLRELQQHHIHQQQMLDLSPKQSNNSSFIKE